MHNYYKMFEIRRDEASNILINSIYDKRVQLWYNYFKRKFPTLTIKEENNN